MDNETITKWRSTVKHFIENGFKNCWGCYVDYHHADLHRCHIQADQFGGKDEPQNYALLCKCCHEKSTDVKDQSLEDMLMSLIYERIDLENSNIKSPHLFHYLDSYGIYNTLLEGSVIKKLQYNYNIIYPQNMQYFTFRILDHLLDGFISCEKDIGEYKDWGMIHEFKDLVFDLVESDLSVGHHFGISFNENDDVLYRKEQDTKLKSIKNYKKFVIDHLVEKYNYHYKKIKEFDSQSKKFLEDWRNRKDNKEVRREILDSWTRLCKEEKENDAILGEYFKKILFFKRFYNDEHTHSLLDHNLINARLKKLQETTDRCEKFISEGEYRPDCPLDDEDISSLKETISENESVLSWAEPISA